MIKKAYLILALPVLLFMAHPDVFCQGELTQEDEARFGLAQSLNNSSKYAESQELLSALHERYPENKDIAFELAMALGYGKNIQEAVKLFDMLENNFPEDENIKYAYANVLEANQRFSEAKDKYLELLNRRPDDQKMLSKIARISVWAGDYETAVKMLKDLLSKNPDDNDSMLLLARIYSWNRKYPESLALYDEIIAKKPAWILPYREKARVLGWMGEYQQSIDEYNRIAKDIGPDEASRQEMLSKEQFYKHFDAKALKEYKEWLRLEPDNLEARLDLAQIYSRQMQWDDAQEEYNKILAIYPHQFMSEQALGKIKMYSESLLAYIGTEFYEADSASRNVDEKYYRIYSGIHAPINKNIYFNLREDNFLYFTSEISRLNRERLLFALEYNIRPFFWSKAGYSYNIYSNDIKNSHNYNGEINLNPLDGYTFSFFYDRQDITVNPQTIKRSLKKGSYKVRGLCEPNRRLSLGADYAFSDYNDDNTSNAYGLDIKSFLSYEPRGLAVTYRYEGYGFDEPKDYYFTPHSFHGNVLGLEWRHFLNKEGLFWGANDTYYTLRYSANFDVNRQTGHKLYADFHKDYSDRLAMHIEWQKHIYEHKNTYGEDRALIYLKYYF